jgi:type I restriction enzyme M protein
MAGRGRPKKTLVGEAGKGAEGRKVAKANGNGGNVGFEAELFKAADKLRGNMEPSDYKHVALVLGRVYEYFLGQFAGAEGKRGGEFYTPRSVVPQGNREGAQAVTAAIFWLKTRARWKEPATDTNMNLSADGSIAGLMARIASHGRKLHDPS